MVRALLFIKEKGLDHKSQLWVHGFDGFSKWWATIELSIYPQDKCLLIDRKKSLPGEKLFTKLCIFGKHCQEECLYLENYIHTIHSKDVQPLSVSNV